MKDEQQVQQKPLTCPKAVVYWDVRTAEGHSSSCAASFGEMGKILGRICTRSISENDKRDAASVDIINTDSL
jgi:hypothetical protein